MDWVEPAAIEEEDEFPGEVLEIPSGVSLLPGEISWQHFPRSTSSKSFCDSSVTATTEEEDLGVTFSAAISTERLPSPIETHPSIRSPKKIRSVMDAQHYLKIRHISELFNFMLCHLVCEQPENPLEYLVELLDSCMAYRDGFTTPPLLFNNTHVQAMYSAFDPLYKGRIDSDQYEEAMRSIGINKSPNYKPSDRKGAVEEIIFKTETERFLTADFNQMVRIPDKSWELSRVKWDKKQARVSARQKITAPRTTQREGEEKKSDESLYCRCRPSFQPINKNVCECPLPKVMHEPEQLFLHV